MVEPVRGRASVRPTLPDQNPYISDKQQQDQHGDDPFFRPSLQERVVRRRALLPEGRCAVASRFGLHCVNHPLWTAEPPPQVVDAQEDSTCPGRQPVLRPRLDLAEALTEFGSASPQRCEDGERHGRNSDRVQRSRPDQRQKANNATNDEGEHGAEGEAQEQRDGLYENRAEEEHATEGAVLVSGICDGYGNHEDQICP